MKITGSFYRFWTMAFIVVIGFSLTVLPEQWAVAGVTPPVQAYQPVTSVGQLPQAFNCLHVITIRYPGCHGEMLWLFIRRWVASHLRLDTSRWGVPVYVEFDEADQVRRISILCLHLIRGKP
jgi:hypothetical protein